MKKKSDEIFQPETASDFFEQLERALRHSPDYARIYRHFNQVLQKCINQCTAETRVILAGTFAKIDYLLKGGNAPADLVKRINDTRVRLRKRNEFSPEEIGQCYLYDLQNICRFIAFIFNVDVPHSLQALFPARQEESSTSSVMGERLRMIVDHWDNDFVYGPSEETDGLDVQVCYSVNTTYNYDWTYLRGMFYKGAQLNIIRPREKDGVFYPELIIFEPDYLVDISTVSRCFTSYADSPYVNLLRKLEPTQSTEATLLGNFAGQLLDEQIHNMPHAYKDSVTDFWKHNALGLLSAGISGNNFHAEAQKQKNNIAQAIENDLPQDVPGFDPKECMVEPSFFSEMLGLQGRMDLLQLDYKLLLEQKSGKGEFPYENFVIPKHREEHYVQMLLYMLLIRYNFHDIYERNGHNLYAFLLYSKYKKSLVGLGFSSELIFRAIKVRNGLACTEMRFAQNDGMRILETLTPDSFNLKHVSNKLWEQYQYPQIARVLSPIQKATELERAYYFRFLNFIANEHVLSKLGNKTKENAGFAAKWYDSLEDKLLAGNIYDRLSLLYPNQQHAGPVKKIKLKFVETDNNDMSNFRVGDVVILYPYQPGTEPDARQTMVFRGSIERIDPETIDILLRATQSDARVFLRYQNMQWAIEHDFLESSYSYLYSGMHAFLSAPKQRRDLLLLQREPLINAHRTINGSYGSFDNLMNRVKRADDLFLIIGPPGTGKTSFGLLNTLKEELTEPGSSVLLLSYTNRAVDEICSKLYQDNIDFIRIGGELTCSPEYRDNTLSTRSRQCSNLESLRQMISTTRVFVATTSSMNSNLALFQFRQFSLAIIDEASQILEPHLIGLLSAHVGDTPVLRKIVMIGDHKQLPAVVQQKPSVSEVHEPILNEVGLTDCRLSLFERLLRHYRQNPDVVYMLTKQGRMHQDIAMFPNLAFYNGQLQVVPLPHQTLQLSAASATSSCIDTILDSRRIAFIDVPTPETSPSDKVNQAEADVIASLVLRIWQKEREHFDVTDTLGIIVPYRNQIATIRNTIDRFGISQLHEIAIDTVERFQGSQRRYIIYGFTIQQYYQLDFLTSNVFQDQDGTFVDPKLNVAMTRAEEHLIIVGNRELLSHNGIFRHLISFITERNGYFNLHTQN